MDTQKLETALEDVYKKAPALPASAKKLIVEWLPWINLVAGAWTLLVAYWLWQWAHTVNRWVDYVNEWNAALGTPTVHVNRMSVTVWLSLAVLVANAVIYLVAFPALKDRKMSGWRLLFLAALFNVVAGVVLLFTDYGSFGNLFGSVVSTAIGLYFLFQIKSEYAGAKHAAPVAAKAPEAHKETAEKK